MPRINAPVVSFNHGLVSPLALARVDLSRLRFAAEQQNNFVPRTVGPMSLRPGWEYVDNTRNHQATTLIPFVFSNDDTALLEVVGSALRVRIDEELVTRTAVTATVSNGDFGSSTNWTLASSSDLAPVTIAGGYLTLNAFVLGSICSASQTIAITETTTEHALRIVVLTGPVEFRIGTTSGDDSIFRQSKLGRGEHSIAFTPNAASIVIAFESKERRQIIVDSCVMEGAGDLTLTVPWAAADHDKLRWEQSGDIVFVACEGYQQRKIERRSTTSWSLVYYEPKDGPFRVAPSTDVSLTMSGHVGNITVQASAPLFRSTHVGSLFSIFNDTQHRAESLAAEDTYVEPIRMAGVSFLQGKMADWTQIATNGLFPAGQGTGGSRSFNVRITGTWSGTLTLQRSFDGPDSGFIDVLTYTANTFTGYTDIFENSVVWYRVGFKDDAYGSGTAVVELSHPGGGGSGTIRIQQVFSPTLAVAEVLDQLASFASTKQWLEGAWSDRYSWPTSVVLHEGRLWWFGKDRIWGSISDAYESFDPAMEGDAGAIARSVGYGPINRINWALPLQRLILGLEGSEASVRSTQFDEPLSPTNFAIKDISTQGSATIAAVKMDTRGIFVQKSNRRVYQIMYSVDTQDYGTADLTALLPDIDSNLIKVAVQRQPDTRIHIVRADGTVQILLFEPTEEVLCWFTASTDGEVENVCVLPGEVEDKVYYVVKRTIDGQTVRFIERWSLESQNKGRPEARLADAHVVYDGVATDTITGLDHLEGEEVVCWAWDDDDDSGTDLGTFTVDNGSITLPDSYENAVVGLGYQARFKSAKLAYAAAKGTALTQKKRIAQLGLILQNTHQQGLTFGRDFTNMDPLPLVYRGAAIAGTAVYETFDEAMFALPGNWDTDHRLYLEANAPRPCTVMGCVIGMETNDKD